MIVERLRCLGLQPGFGDDYEQPVVVDGAATANAVGYLRGRDPTVGDEIILVAAHHDHLGAGHLGANDNASGVVALLAIARAVRQLPVSPRRTIAFALFGGEEAGMIGSTYFVAHAPAALPIDRIVQVVNLDMVGSYPSRGLVAAMGAFTGLPARRLLDPLIRDHRRLSVVPGGKARGSDFLPFCDRGVPYVFFWTPDARCYHQLCDTADRIDLGHMVEITKLAGALIDQLGDTTLDLVDARRRLGCFGRR